MARRRPWSFLTLLASAIAVIVGMLVMADRARDQADRARQAQNTLERLHGTTERLDAITWHNLATLKDGATPPAVVAQGLDAFRDINADLRALRRLGLPHDRLKAIERPVGVAYGQGLQAIMMTRTDPRAARSLATARFTPTVDRINAEVAAATRTQDRRAQRANTRMELGWLGSLGVGLLLLVLLSLRLQRIQRRSAEAEQARAVERRSEDRLRTLVRHSSDAVAVIEPSSKVRWITESIRGVLGYEPDDLVGRHLTELVHPDEAHRAFGLLEEGVAHEGRAGTVSVRARTASGEYRLVEVVADNLLASPDVAGILLNIRDVTERRALEDQLRHRAFHDDLTGLPNRALFDDRLTQALVRMRRHGDRTAVIFIDLDDFKTVNDSLGHAVGDDLLRATSKRLEGALRAQDTAARLGGDEFAVLAEEVADEDEAVAIAERLRLAITAPLEVGGRRITPSASLGLACPDAVVSAQEVLGNADVAMYAAKARGKGRVVRFEAGMRDRVVERLELTGELETALEDDQLFLEYQPIVELQTGAIHGVEALVRWNHPTKGRLEPGRFIALAESTGQIVPIGRWVLHTACAQLRAWERDDPAARGLEMNVNVSTRQLADPDFPAQLRAILTETGLAPERLTLEITEYLLLDDSHDVVQRLRALKEIGVRLAVDDFGTGYSALSYLQSFPVDELKIDRSFVTGIDRDAEKARLVQGIIDIGNSLDLRVVTEGIEASSEAAVVRDLHSGHGQGYLFSRPVAPAAIAALLSEGARLPAGASHEVS